MGVIEPVNTQQILQMGSHVEKVQQIQQQQPLVVAHHLDQERAALDEVKRTEVQDPEDANASVLVDPDKERLRGRLRIRRKDAPIAPLPAAPPEERQPDPALTEKGVGKRLNVTA